ncbi:MAG: hypothetical protein FJ297_18395 [Planctomycetes bacterium]|nr:hypothetical protein [Planctomycetota bacterium]
MIVYTDPRGSVTDVTYDALRQPRPRRAHRGARSVRGAPRGNDVRLHVDRLGQPDRGPGGRRDRLCICLRQ